MRRMLAVLICASMLSLHISAYSVMTDCNVYRHHDNGAMKIALTFDDGPSPFYTADILDYLAEEGIHATFFVIGSQARIAPELLCREKKEGHEIGNHTDSHLRLSGNCGGDVAKTLIEEIDACARTVYEQTEIQTTLFRPPEGFCTEAISRACAEKDYRIILWNIDTRDWTHIGAAEIAENVLSNVSSGAIILFHDGVSRSDSQTLAALKRIVPILKERGYQFVTVSELLSTESA